MIKHSLVSAIICINLLHTSLGKTATTPRTHPPIVDSAIDFVVSCSFWSSSCGADRPRRRNGPDRDRAPANDPAVACTCGTSFSSRRTFARKKMSTRTICAGGGDADRDRDRSIHPSRKRRHCCCCWLVADAVDRPAGGDLPERDFVDRDDFDRCDRVDPDDTADDLRHVCPASVPDDRSRPGVIAMAEIWRRKKAAGVTAKPMDHA